jgi:FolB domain-containing protein
MADGNFWSMEMDSIHIEDLHARCILGIGNEERREKQDVVINITLFADLSKAAQTDSIDDTIDYAALKKKILDSVEKSEYYLAEALAQHIANLCLDDPRVIEVKIKVEKPAALRFARSVAVEIFRKGHE